MKSLRLKKLSNPWMTHDIIKLMYLRDHVHTMATQSNDSKLWQDYRNLRNKVTCIIKDQKNVYFNDNHTLCRNDPKNKHSHITCDISANDFNNHFVNISNKINSNFQNFDANFYGKAPKVFIIFVSRRRVKISKHIWDFYLINPIIIYWIWTSFF